MRTIDINRVGPELVGFIRVMFTPLPNLAHLLDLNLLSSRNFLKIYWGK